MDDRSDRRTAALCGLLGGVLIGLEGLLSLARSALDLTRGWTSPAYFLFDQGIVFLVLGLVVAVFSFLGGMRPDGRAMVAGIVLLVVVILGWLALGLGTALLSLLGAVLALVGGVVFLASAR